MLTRALVCSPLTSSYTVFIKQTGSGGKHLEVAIWPKNTYHFAINNNIIYLLISYIYKQGCATSLNRLESKTINELRLGVLGLNRMKIQKE